nr:protease Do-like 2, chloroplastic isoform X2 [Ziziphus jujuba var. spinosa]
MDGRSYLYEESYKGSADKGKTQPGGYKFGMQRKDKKELQYDLKDLQVELGNLQDAAFLNVVVKVYCTHIAPDYSLPWQKQSSIQVLAGKVKVTRRGDDTKYVAKDSITVVGYPLGGDTISVKRVSYHVERE